MQDRTIFRPREMLNFFRSYSIFIDDKKVFELKSGEKKSFKAPLNAKITAKIDWCQSNPVQLQDSSSIIVQANRNLFITMLISLIAMPIVFMIRPEYALSPIVIGALAIVYYISFGRKSFLQITSLK